VIFLARLNVPKKVVKENPESENLLNEGETVDLPVDDFLKRWFNNYLKMQIIQKN